MKIFQNEILKKLGKKRIAIIIIIIVVLVFVVYQSFVRKENNSFILEKVSQGTILQEVSETGTVKISEKLNLGFESSGRIEKIYVKVGDQVKTGQELVKLDTDQLNIQLREALAALEVIQAQKTDTQISLDNAYQSLKDAEAEAKKNLDKTYNNSLAVLDDSYSKLYATYSIVYEIQQRYFSSYQGQSGDFIDNKDIIKNSLDKTKIYLADAKKNPQGEKIESIFADFEKLILAAKDALNKIIDIVRSIGFSDLVLSTDKTSLDTQRTYISTAYSNIISSQQEIATTKTTNETKIHNAQSQVSSLENQLKENQGGLYEAKINQAQAQISLLQNQIQDAVLKSPTDGQITEINKKEGETVQPTDSIITFLPSGPFQIEIDIYEEDIVKIKIGDPTDIILAAFPDKKFLGEVILINPAEKLIDGVVYYEVTIDFKENTEGIKPGMTADVVIKTGEKENVLIIPKAAVKKTDNKTIVNVFRNNKIEEREVEIGLKGNDFFEVISGLQEGEEVLMGKK